MTNRQLAGWLLVDSIKQTEAAKLSIVRRHINKPRILIDHGGGVLRAGASIIALFRLFQGMRVCCNVSAAPGNAEPTHFSIHGFISVWRDCG